MRFRRSSSFHPSSRALVFVVLGGRVPSSIGGWRCCLFTKVPLTRSGRVRHSGGFPIVGQSRGFVCPLVLARVCVLFDREAEGASPPEEGGEDVCGMDMRLLNINVEEK